MSMLHFWLAFRGMLGFEILKDFLFNLLGHFDGFSGILRRKETEGGVISDFFGECSTTLEKFQS